jgi:two-component system, sensor histidine kinase and response regulator
MDVQMPVMDGYAATRKIREWESGRRNEEKELKAEARGQRAEVGDQKSGDKDHAASVQPQTYKIPIIAMTAHAMAGDEQKSLEAGMNDHVTKPIDPDQLFATLQKWIKPLAERVAAGEEQRPDAPAAADPAVTEKAELPESLPGFDLAAGFARLRGNKRLYRKLLLDFGANYGGVADDIREALRAKNFSQAHSLVHNLKGLAGNLEAKELQAAAAAMEKLVKGQTAETAAYDELNRELAGLQGALAQALDAVRTLGPIAEKKAVENIADRMSSVPPELARKAADRIKAAAEMGDVLQAASIAKELQSENEMLTPFCDRILQLAENFDLDGILKLTDELSSHRTPRDLL